MKENRFGAQPAESEQSQELREQLAKLLPAQEDRDGLVVNKLDNKKPREPLSPEELNLFREEMHRRIAEEMAREKTTLPKEKLQQLDRGLDAEPELVGAIVESFGYAVASDPFMLYGLMRKTEELIQLIDKHFNETVPHIMPGHPTSIAGQPDEEIIAALKEFWNYEDLSKYGKTEFPIGDDIAYFSGEDVNLDNKDDVQFADAKSVPGYRYIFGPTRKRKMDYAGKFFGSQISQELTTKDPHGVSRFGLSGYALQFRDNSDFVKNPDKSLVTGYPAEWYIVGSGKGKVLKDFFQKYALRKLRGGRRW